MLNAAGSYTEPTPQNVAVSLLKAKINTNESDPSVYLTQDLREVYTDTDPRNYQLSSYSYLILPTKIGGQFNELKGKTLAAFSYYAMCQAQQQSASLGYSPMPINLVEASLEQITKIPGAVVQNINLKDCKNPTFSADGTNRRPLHRRQRQAVGRRQPVAAPRRRVAAPRPAEALHLQGAAPRPVEVLRPLAATPPRWTDRPPPESIRRRAPRSRPTARRWCWCRQGTVWTQLANRARPAIPTPACAEVAQRTGWAQRPRRQWVAWCRPCSALRRARVRRRRSCSSSSCSPWRWCWCPHWHGDGSHNRGRHDPVAFAAPFDLVARPPRRGDGVVVGRARCAGFLRPGSR
jgi:hypothetical protein